MNRQGNRRRTPIQGRIAPLASPGPSRNKQAEYANHVRHRRNRRQPEVAGQLYDGLTVLQHRGQDAAGIATADGTRLRLHKGNGLVRDVFDAQGDEPAGRSRRHRPLPLSDRRLAKAWTRPSRST